VRALTRVRIASIIGLLAGAFGVVALVDPQAINVITVSSSMQGSSFTLQFPTLLAVYFGGAVVLAFVEVALLRFSFHILSDVEKDFSTPSTLALLALVGLALVVVGFGVLLYALAQAISCAGAGNPITSTCLQTGTLLGAAGILLVGAIILLVGYIGILIGIWRLGNRFDNSLFKIGAVFLIFPFLSLIGQILILIASSQELGRPQ
jgi:hypothetical protein